MNKSTLFGIIFLFGATFTVSQNAMAVIADDPEPKVVFEEDFSLFPAVEKPYGKLFGNDDTNCLHPEYFHQQGWKGLNIGYDQGVIYFSMEEDVYLQTPPIELSADGGKVTVTFEYKLGFEPSNPNTTDHIYVQLRDRANGMDSGITGIYNNGAEVNKDWRECSVTLTGGTADCSIRFWTGSFNGLMRNLKVKQVRPELDAPVADAFSDFTGSSLTANWREVTGAEHYLLSVFTLENDVRDYLIEDLKVTDTSYAISGLDPKKVYHYTVKAVGNGLTSEESNTVRCFGIAQPAIIDFANVSKDGFNVFWNEVENAELYQLESYLVHTAPTAERYCLFDEDFLNTPGQDATPDNPVSDGTSGLWLDDYSNRSNWYVKQPMFANDCITLNNILASMGIYGEIDGPTMDLSADGGKVTVEMRVRALEIGGAASLSLYMLNSVPKVNEFTSDKIVDRIELWSEDSEYEGLTTSWQNRTFTLRGGNEESYIAIQAYGYGALVQIDRIAIYQELKEGESVRVPYRSIITTGNDADILTNGEGFNADNDQFVCELRGANTSDSDEVVYSIWSEPKSVTLPSSESGISAIGTDSNTAAGENAVIYDILGRKLNAAQAKSGIYIVNGKKVVR